MNHGGETHAHGDASRVKSRVALGVGLGARAKAATRAEAIDLLLIGGWAPRARCGDAEGALAAATAFLDRLVALGLNVAVGDGGEARFDPAEAANLAAAASLDLGDRLWFEHVEMHRALAWRLFGLSPQAGQTPPPLRSLPPVRFTLRLTRAFNTPPNLTGRPARLRVPLPVDDATLSDLQFTAIAPADAAWTRGPGRLEVKLADARSGPVEIGFEASFTLAPSNRAPPAPLPPDERALYTRESEGAIKVTPALKRLAVDITAGASDRAEQIARLARFTVDNLRCGYIHYDEIDLREPVEWALRNGWVDCRMYAAVFVSLCRALGVPARLVGGWLIDEIEPAGHFWAECWTDDGGWAPYDPATSWYMSAAGGDPAWSEYYFGAAAYSLVTERLPRLFTGSGSSPFPPRWHFLRRLADQGVETSYLDSQTGALIYAERMEVTRDPPLPPWR